MTTAIYWFRNDLRLLDNPAFTLACHSASKLLPVFIHDPAASEETRWGFTRTGVHRQRFLADTLTDLHRQLASQGSALIELHGTPEQILPALASACKTRSIFCETITAPQEQAQLAALRAAGLQVDSVWQSSMLALENLPFPVQRLPDMFTAFRHAVEKAGVLPASPLPLPTAMPPLPDLADLAAILPQPEPGLRMPAVAADPRSSFPYQAPACSGGSSAALAHVESYFERKLAHTYKQTRNGIIGTDYSSKFSPWLASGALSARSVYRCLKQFESQHGANDGSYWLWFELLWRDYFRFLHCQHGVKLYRAHGLADATAFALHPPHHAPSFQRWCLGETGEPMVDAGMHELAATGYLSNRLRQIVASYLIHDLACDWRAGAAWFEAQLVDFDVYSNQGNWLYISGRGTDPRGGRRFNPQKQAQDYDAKGQYRALWRT
jgi:deoxyribodipyrimidine photo-lyase